MKRSEVNAYQREAAAFFQQQNFHLPPWAFWSEDDWRKNREQVQEIIALKLGWDVTDFGLGDFQRAGLLLFTLRNGRVGQTGGKDYAEKVLIVRPQQVTPWHFHWHKMEDIISTRKKSPSMRKGQNITEYKNRANVPHRPMVNTTMATPSTPLIFIISARNFVISLPSALKSVSFFLLPHHSENTAKTDPPTAKNAKNT